jgi:hypothetical protein
MSRYYWHHSVQNCTADGHRAERPISAAAEIPEVLEGREPHRLTIQ